MIDIVCQCIIISIKSKFISIEITIIIRSTFWGYFVHSSIHTILKLCRGKCSGCWKNILSTPQQNEVDACSFNTKLIWYCLDFSFNFICCPFKIFINFASLLEGLLYFWDSHGWDWLYAPPFLAIKIVLKILKEMIVGCFLCLIV